MNPLRVVPTMTRSSEGPHGRAVVAGADGPWFELFCINDLRNATLRIWEADETMPIADIRFVTSGDNQAAILGYDGVVQANIGIAGELNFDRAADRILIV